MDKSKNYNLGDKILNFFKLLDLPTLSPKKKKKPLSNFEHAGCPSRQLELTTYRPLKTSCFLSITF